MFSFIETTLFSRLVIDYLSDEEYGKLQQVLMNNPEAGPLFELAVAWGRLDGLLLVVESVVDTELSILFAGQTT